MGLTEEHYQIAKENGISRQLVYQRYEMLFWSVEDAVTKPVQRTDDDYKHWKEVAQNNGLSYIGFRKRVVKGMTPEEAATTPKRKPWGFKRGDNDGTRKSCV